MCYCISKDYIVLGLVPTICRIHGYGIGNGGIGNGVAVVRATALDENEAPQWGHLPIAAATPLPTLHPLP